MARIRLFMSALLGLSLANCSTAPPPLDPPASQSEVSCQIRMTQVGFLVSGPKRIILNTQAASPLSWRVLDAAGSVVAVGESVPAGPDAASGVDVHVINIEAPLAQGDGYVIDACGQTSRPFAVQPDIYAGLSEDALRYFYHNRIGTPIEAQFVQGPEWARPESFNPVIATCFAGEDMFGNTWPACGHELDVTGSWFDAGDFGVYGVNMGISIWTLQSAYERIEAPDLLEASGWADGRMQLPETGNGVSEILDEARWGLESLLALQIPDGAQVWTAALGATATRDQALKLQNIDGSGLVHHKLSGRQWPPLPMWPWEDVQERVLYPPSTAATLALAATGAQCARLWAGKDDAFSARCYAAAIRAYDAAKRHPAILASNNFDGSGGYTDDTLGDEFAWAAAELYITTGDPAYLEDLQSNPAFNTAMDTFGWADVGLMPAISLALNSDGRSAATAGQARQMVIRAADSALSVRDAEGYRVPLRASEYAWGSNSIALNRGLVLAAAYDLTSDVKYRDGAIDAMEYVLGRNIIDQSYVSGYGARPMQAPHHRIWAQSVDPAFPPPPPGALSGGANNIAMTDPVAMKLKGTCAPMACWADDAEAYALNEVAINWNAPLAALAIFLDQTEKTISSKNTDSTGE